MALPRRKRSKARPALERPGPPGGVRDVNRREKTRAIHDAALVLFLERGLGTVSVDDIMKAARMAKGSFYRYFDDQAALVTHMYLPVRELVSEALEACSRELETADSRDAQFTAYRKVGNVVAALLLGYAGEARLYLQECRAPGIGPRKPIVELSRLISRYAIDITSRAQRQHILRPVPPAVSALAVIGAAERLILGVLTEEPLGANPLEVADQLTNLFLDGLKAQDEA